jgi:hypothetical protein
MRCILAALCGSKKATWDTGLVGVAPQNYHTSNTMGYQFQMKCMLRCRFHLSVNFKKHHYHSMTNKISHLNANLFKLESTNPTRSGTNYDHHFSNSIPSTALCCMRTAHLQLLTGSRRSSSQNINNNYFICFLIIHTSVPVKVANAQALSNSN